MQSANPEHVAASSRGDEQKTLEGAEPIVGLCVWDRTRGDQMSDRLGGPAVRVRAADLLFAVVFLIVATVVVVAALLHI
jgi:hypothetical protein